MGCPSCGRTDPPGARFCGGCGTSLAPRCPACGAECPADARFCVACGSPQAGRPDDAAGQALRALRADETGERKVVTIVFADLIGSTALHERLDPESANRLMDRYYRAVRAPIEAHGGSVVSLLGDGVMCAFGVPRVSEDDAIRAVRAGVDLQRAFREFAEREGTVASPLGLRVAVNTGEVVASSERAELLGDPVNVAARLQQEAHDGDVLIAGSTQRLVADRITLAPVGSFSLRGRSEPVSAYRVVSLERPAGAAAVGFVGRQEELERLTAVFEAAVAAPATRLALVLGSPGLGKSRLVAELGRRLGERATVLTAQCNAAGGATFAPLAEALRAELGLESGDALRAAIDSIVPGEEERERIAGGIAALLAGTPDSPEETFFVVRRLLSALAARQPVVLAIDDLHWAEPLLLDLTEHLVQWGAGVPLLVLAAARPELREARSSLAVPGGGVADVVTLGGLDANAATRLAANVIGADALPAAVAGRVLATSEGNPLFVGELVRMLVQDGALRREGDRWTTAVELADLEMPPTIQALLAARIARLRPEDRLVLERASVVGRHFSRAAVAHLLPGEARADLDARLESLRRSELVEPGSGWLLGEPALRFHHVLIRDAAYRRVLKETRAELHERFADWIAARAGESVEHDETIGWHLEQAHQNLRELGPVDEHGRALGERAARRLGAAGRRALARDDLLPAASLLRRALDRLEADDPTRPDLALDGCEALLSAGEVGGAARAIAELGRFVADSDRLRAWHTCFSGQLAVLTDPKALRASADAVAAAAETLTAVGDAVGEAKAHAVHAQVLAQLGKIAACEASLDKALAAARRVQDRRRANAVLAGAPLAALWGPSPVTRASGRCLDVVRVLRITQVAPAVEAVALRCQAVLETLRSRGEAARRMIAASRQLVEELGITQRVLEADLFAGLIELLEGDAAAAERWLRSAWDGLREHGLGIDAAQAGALLARALLAQRRIAEAEAVSFESESLAGDSFKAAIAWRGVRAEVLAARGEHATALELARAAVEIAAATDDLLDHADARASLAVALRAAGRGAEADAEERRAIELWEAKGATRLVDRARRTAAAGAPVASDGVEAPAARPASRPRVQTNDATLHLSRIDEAVAARDLQAVRWLLGEDTRALDHVSGRWYDVDSLFETFRWMVDRSADLAYGNDPIATLGPSLALARWYESSSGVAGDDLPIGPFETGGLVLVEADSEARSRRTVEVFAADKLGDAVVRLYERYAELLPEGPEREHAARAARSFAAVLGPFDLDRYATALAPDVEFVDQRTLGLGAAEGAKAVLRLLGSTLETSAHVATRIDDVLALRADALLAHWTTFGTSSVGGGAYERSFVGLHVAGADGLLMRVGQFDADREDEALARFDALVATPRPTTRRGRPNAATAHAERQAAAIAARDASALPALSTDDLRVVHHPSHSVYGREEWLRALGSFIQARSGRFSIEPLATLGDSLALCRSSFSASGAGGGRFDVGPFEYGDIALLDVDALERCRHTEIFAPDRLADAVVRLYERYAELLPEGAARTQAAAIARSIAVMMTKYDPEGFAAAWSPSIEYVDRRTTGVGAISGIAPIQQWLRGLLDDAEDVVNRVDEILCARPEALLHRMTNAGTLRASRGSYERCFLLLMVLGSDGLASHLELFDADREAEALDRVDELVRAPARPARRRVRPNAVSRFLERTHAAIAARDGETLAALHAPGLRVVHHRAGRVLLREEVLAWWRLFFGDRGEAFRAEAIAALGDSLLLYRQTWMGGSDDGGVDVGPFQQDSWTIAEVDADERAALIELFGTGQLGDVVARLYERYAERLPEGREHTRAAAIARAVAACNGPIDPDRLAAFLSPSLRAVDHRFLGSWSAQGSEAWLHHWRLQLELASDFTRRDDDVLALEPDALLTRHTYSGTDRATGGTFENALLALWIFGADGLLTRVEGFDPDREAEALARFDEVRREAPAPRIENLATRFSDRAHALVAARDLAGMAAGLAPGMQVVDRRRLGRIELDRDQHLESLRFVMRLPVVRIAEQTLATRGRRLALYRQTLHVSDRDTGPSELEHLLIVEVDDEGEQIDALVFFDLDALDAAYAELDARYDAGEARPYPAVRATLERFLRALQTRDWDPLASVFTSDFAVEDHRLLGTLSTLSRDEWIASARALAELRPDTTLRVEHVLALDDRGSLAVGRWIGREAEGAFEISLLVVTEYSEGRIRRWHAYDLDQLDQARARFAELGVASA